MAQPEPESVTTTPGGISAKNDLMYRLAQRTIGTLLLLPARTIYRGTSKQYSVVRVQKDYKGSIAEKRGNTKQWDFWLKPTETGLFARVTNPAICGGLDFIRAVALYATLATEIRIHSCIQYY
jgi:hypothetical protein